MHVNIIHMYVHEYTSIYIFTTPILTFLFSINETHAHTLISRTASEVML